MNFFENLFRLINFGQMLRLGCTVFVLMFFMLMITCDFEVINTGDSIPNPLDTFLAEHPNEKEFSVILHDMKREHGINLFTKYFHQYEYIRHDAKGSPFSKISDWKQLSHSDYQKHKNNLGMVILQKKADGSISKFASPPGYRYVNNPKYGEWKTYNGNTFWTFLGAYFFMNQIFRLGNQPIFKNDYEAFQNGRYFGKKHYYGPYLAGTPKYGTNSTYTRRQRPNFYRRRRSFNSRSNSRSQTWSRSRSSGFGK